MTAPAVRLVLAPLVLPHEAAHALPAVVAGLDPEITLLPSWDDPARPLARFNASLDRTTPTWLIRTIALAPFPIHLALAAGVGALVPADSPLVFPLFVLHTFWASPSEGDIAVAANPDAACAAGEFLAPADPTRVQSVLAFGSVVVAALAVGVALFR
jgi:hypothetical protein